MSKNSVTHCKSQFASSVTADEIVKDNAVLFTCGLFVIQAPHVRFSLCTAECVCRKVGRDRKEHNFKVLVTRILLLLLKQFGIL